MVLRLNIGEGDKGLDTIFPNSRETSEGVQVQTIFGEILPTFYIATNYGQAETDDVYRAINGVQTTGSTSQAENVCYCVMPRDGTLKNLIIRCPSNTIEGATTFTIRKNGADTTLVVSIAGLQTTESGNFKNYVNVKRGDLIALRVQTGAGLADSTGTILSVVEFI